MFEEDFEIAETISANHVSDHEQIFDALVYIARIWPEKYAEFHAEFPEGFSVYSESMSLVNTYDPDYADWVVQWIEAETPITWFEGEPVIFADSSL